MERYDLAAVLRRLGIACVLLTCIVALGWAENPDGPVGAVALEPSFTFGGLADSDRTVFAPDTHGGFRTVGLPANDINLDWQRYGLGVLVPIKPKFTLGGHFAYTHIDRTDNWPWSVVESSVDGWEVGFSVRIWLNADRAQD